MASRRDLGRVLRPCAAVLLLAAASSTLASHAAMAQFSMGNGGSGPAPGGGPDDEREAQDAAQKAQAKADAKAAAPPPAIPGAVTDEATATSGHASLDMEPTAALFDAINRGDITSAKEALGRGADLDGKNVLGQTPLDMAIDLNRNDLTFLLLSMRNTEDGPPVASVAKTERASPVKLVASKEKRGRKGHDVAAAAASRNGVKPRQYASDGGAPQPEIGFLGFGGS